jgi:tetratricopeptide (TPR) repeat protein
VVSHPDPPQLLRARLRLALHSRGGRSFNPVVHHERGRYCLVVDGGAEEVRGRHLAWFLALAEEAELQSRSSDREAWFDRLQADHDNLRAAFGCARQRGVSELELRLATALWRFWSERGHVSEGKQRLEEAIERNPRRPPGALLGRCYLRQMTSSSSFADVLAEAEAIAASCRGEGDRYVKVQALSLAGAAEISLGHFTKAETTLEDALGFSNGDYPAEDAELAGWLLISALYGPLPTDQGITRCKRAYARSAQNRTVQAFALVERAALEAMRGEFDSARSLLTEGRAVFFELGLKVFGANTAQEAYFVEMLAGDPDAAANDLRNGYEQLDEMGERSFLSTIAGYLAHALLAQGDLAGAEKYARLSAEAAAADDNISQCLWRSAQAKLLATERDFEQALDLADEAIRLMRATEQINTQADRLTNLAEIHLIAGKHQEAHSALTDALQLYEEKGNLISANDIRGRLEALIGS